MQLFDYSADGFTHRHTHYSSWVFCKSFPFRNKQPSTFSGCGKMWIGGWRYGHGGWFRISSDRLSRQQPTFALHGNAGDLGTGSFEASCNAMIGW